MLELFPEGFEELDHPDGLELVAYTDDAGEERAERAARRQHLHRLRALGVAPQRRRVRRRERDRHLAGAVARVGARARQARSG